ncbi:MAG: amino acid adenylation domain-containing protein [Caldilineaceae bacterium]|nr:amino acid adenylation domain-containing protein [Caldilineaceae bacterium]
MQESIIERWPHQTEGGQSMVPVAPQLSDLSDRCLHQVFEAQAAQTPDAIALRFGKATLTYGELNRRANQLAHHLRTLGVGGPLGTELLIGLAVERTMDAIIGMLGILKAGGAYVPLDPAYPLERLTSMLADAKVAMLITRADSPSPLAATLANQPVTIVQLDTDAAQIAGYATDNPPFQGTPDQVMYVIYTSGSTGKPKGIMVTHRNVARLFPAVRPYLAFDHTDVWTLFHAYSFGFSVWEIWGALWHGAQLVIVPPAVSQAPDEFYRLVCQEKVTVLSQTPSAFSLFLLADRATKQRAELALRYVVFSGERLDPALLKAWVARHGDAHPQLINMYAISETAGEITYQRLTESDVSQAAPSVIGVPLPDVAIYLLDEAGQPVPTGEAGELYIGSPAVARGYLNQPELTAQKFLPDPFQAEPTARMYRTGDRARYLPNGELEFLGRMDDQVKIRGYRIELGEIQALLASHPAIHEAAVIARTDTASQPQLVAYVVPAVNGLEPPLTTKTLQHYLRATLPEYMVPSTFMKLDQLPRSPNGKLDRQHLPHPDQGAALDAPTGYVAQSAAEKALAQMWGLDTTATVPTTPAMLRPRNTVNAANDPSTTPQTPVEKAIAQIWVTFLGRSQVGLHDDFLELGGNSLLAAQILYRLNDEFQVNLSMRQLLDTSTVAGLAALVTQEQAAQVDSDDLAALLADLAAISDEEVQQQLAVPLGKSRADNPAMPEQGQHEAYMRLAINKAKEAIHGGQAPIAACIVKDGEVIACVHNTVAHDVDVTAHAEMQAIRAACHHLNTTDLTGCVLYSTLEPCPMCFSASQWAKLDTIVYGARREDAEKVGLGQNSIPAQTMKQLGQSAITLVEETLRAENVQLFDLWLGTKNAAHTQYDDIATQFQQIKNSPVNTHITDYTFFSMIGEQARGKRVLDLACGEGRYSRMLKQGGAAQVVGVDISAQMIHLAEQQERRTPLGIEYICRDVLALGKIGDFDLVVASFLLNYAQSKAALIHMCQTVAANLRPGGHFILINENFNQAPQDFHGYERYGYTKTMVEPYQEGGVITYAMSTGTETLQFEGYYWSPATYQMAFAAAGFTDVQWQNLRCSPQGIEEYGQRFWQNFINNPPFIGIICRK